MRLGPFSTDPDSESEGLDKYVALRLKIDDETIESNLPADKQNATFIRVDY